MNSTAQCRAPNCYHDRRPFSSPGRCDFRNTGMQRLRAPVNIRQLRRRMAQRPTQAAATQTAQLARGAEITETEVVVIGSGIGGLSCAALLAKYGVKVSVRRSNVSIDVTFVRKCKSNCATSAFVGSTVGQRVARL